MSTTPSPAPDVGGVPRAGARGQLPTTALAGVALLALQRVVGALGELPVRAPVTTGPVIDPGTLTAPPNVAVTLVKSFVTGVPVVVLPHGRDQADNATRVVHHGAGLSVPRAASPARIADAVRTVLEDRSFADGAALRTDAASGLRPTELEAGLDQQLLRKALR